jgi:pseudaminic acid biosynthesis-associated methylase
VTTDDEQRSDEAARLEALWGGAFGREYVARNTDAGAALEPFLRGVLGQIEAGSALEVGCNIGANLQWVASADRATVGVDINEEALRILPERVSNVSPVLSVARALPVRHEAVDLVFTIGVLIHQPDESLADVMHEMVRATRRYVLCGEYFDDVATEVPYRGQSGALFRRDYGALFLEHCPRLRLLDQGFLARELGWDDVTWWLFEKAR